MRPTRVLWLTDSLTLGGAEALSVAFARARDPDRIDLRVAFLKSLGGNPFEAELRSSGVAPTNLGARNLRDVGAFRRLLALLRTEGIEVVHAHLAYASIWGCLAGALARVPVVVTFHVAPSTDPLWSREGLRRVLRIRLANALARRAVAVSGAVRVAWGREGLDRDKVEVIHNGVALEALPTDPTPRAGIGLREELGIDPDSRIVLTVSVLRSGKGMPDLLSAIARLVAAGEDVTLLLAGDGPLHEELERRLGAEELRDRVHLLGFRRDVPSLLATADVFALPSRWDALPTALLEAMAAGLPVVATETGGIPEIVEDGVSGLLVPPGDPGRLAEALERILGDPVLARRLGEGARERVRRDFSRERWCERLSALYETLAQDEREAAR